jgi:hypothetical protein
MIHSRVAQVFEWQMPEPFDRFVKVGPPILEAC